MQTLSNPLSTLSSAELLQQLKLLVHREREVTVRILDLLEEIDSRKTFLELGYGSLIEFCILELKYSESAAYRRVQAMRARRHLPHIGSELLDGTLSLAVVAKAQGFLRSEEKRTQVPIPLDTRAELFSELKNKSLKETEKILIEKSPDNILAQESIRLIASDIIEMKLFLNSAQLENLNQVRNLVSHRIHNATYSQIVDWMTKEVLEKLNPLFRKDSNTRKDGSELNRGERVHIPSNLKKIIWQRSQGRCCYRSAETGRRCNSKYQLEIDHIIPLAKGGSHEITNLQLLCRAHNQWKADS